MVTRKGIVFLLLSTCVLMAVFAVGKEMKKMSSVTVSSPTFSYNGSIPSRFTCDGQDTSPPLQFGNVPQAARSLALIMDDPDAPAGTWVHWVAWNIPPGIGEIREGSVPEGMQQGLNSWKRNSYGGPCPPSGTHRYFFKVYALDSTLELPLSTTKSGLEKAMKGHVLGSGELMGTYRRQ
ncbi:MAG: YbhB/YbcL family Raf kinase inhibitor-like protein [Geobacteraceae bacterium]|nr:YbhB/YbcL family Raf kinase inhibitor-like protein [Geobacteraceae bacterium]